MIEVYCGRPETWILCPEFFRLTKRGARRHLPASWRERTHGQTEKGRRKKSKFQADRSITQQQSVAPIYKRDYEYMISVRDYLPEDAQDLASIYFNTIHRVNIKDYTQEQVDAWAPPSGFKSSTGTEDWEKKFARTKPIVAVIGDKVIGFAEFEPNGHIDCFYCHHEWIGKGVGSSLMNEILIRAKKNHIHRIFAEVSITAKSFFEKYGFVIVTEQVDYKKGIGLVNYKMERII